MCGIVGIYCKDRPVDGNSNRSAQLRICGEMLKMLRSRGPDECNLVEIGPAVLGHTRLSIIDLATGSQPVFNEDHEIAVILNGEIYNFLELRDQLEKKGHHFTSKSDTEVIVHLYEEVGEQVFSQLNGMFSILIYDGQKDKLLAARDRTGEKPLYYAELEDVIIFASEIKALLKYPSVPTELDREAIALYLNCLYVPAPLSIFKGIKKLLPAHYIKVEKKQFSILPYWQPQISIRWDWKEDEIVEEFVELFSDSVGRRMIADVPLGVFLSGGIDSSAVTAFAAKQSSNPVKTFSVGFSDEFDERPYARLVAGKYETEHHEIFIKDQIGDVFEKAMGYYDEPFGDTSAIPTYLISKEARKQVKVILTGDGGDELFAGYDAYINQKYVFGNRVMTKCFKEFNKATIKYFKRGLLEKYYPHNSSPRAYQHWYRVRTVFDDQELATILINDFVFPSDFFMNHRWLMSRSNDSLSNAYLFDINYYLPDDLLKKVDMASMLCSLECRAPFLDHRLIEFSLQIPPQLKVKNDILKYLLKKALCNYLPKEILARRKHGFGAPVESWMTNQLRDYVTELLNPGCKIEGFIKAEAIKSIKDRFYMNNGRRNYRDVFKLWLLFALEFWIRKYA